MKICRVSIDAANNNSAIATVIYEESEDGSRMRMPGTARLWNDTGARQKNSCLVPSVILYQKENRGFIDKDCYGHDALSTIKKSDAELNICGNIKKRFFVDDNPYGDQARDFCNLVKHLLKCMEFEDGDEPDAYELQVSHPVICDADNLFHLEEIIGEALDDLPMQIHSIRFIDEAECAFRFALSNETVRKEILGALKTKKDYIALVCDIGGSTMELSLYRFMRQGKKVKFQRMGMLRADEEAGRDMGSSRMDKMLSNKLRGAGLLDQEKTMQIPGDLLQVKYFAPLKENLNNRLRAGREGRLDSLYPIALGDVLMKSGAVTKAQFDDWCAGYAAAVCKQIQRLAEQEGSRTEEIDLAILTGGGCELYPVEEAIRRLLGNNACVLRPDDPRSILDCAVDADNPDYFEGLCPKNEIASLACVLGSLADETQLEEYFWLKGPIGIANYARISNFSEGLAAAVKPNGEIDYIDTWGSVVISGAWKGGGDFHEGLALVQNSEGLYGYIDHTGKEVIPCKWKIADDFHEGLARAQNLDGKLYYIDQTGREVIPEKWDGMTQFSDGMATVVSFSGKYGAIDRQGNEITPCKWDAIGELLDGMIMVQNSEGMTGYIDKEGNETIPCIWADGRGFCEGLARVRGSNGRWYYIDQKGNPVITCGWEDVDVGDFYEGMAYVKDTSGQYGYIDRTGKKIIPCSWNWAGDFHEGLARVKNSEGKYGYIDREGKLVIRCYCVDAADFQDGLALTKRSCYWLGYSDTLCVYIDRDGNELGPCHWRALGPFQDGLAAAQDYVGNVGYIDRSGEFVMICERPQGFVDYPPLLVL